MSAVPSEPALPGLEGASARAKGKKEGKPKAVKIRIGQTAITIYPRGNGAWVFRYYVAGKPRLVERAKLDKAREEATRIATGIENGRAQAGAMTVSEAVGYFEAVNQLGKLGGDSPPLGAALAEYIAAKQLLPPNVPLVEAVRGFLKVHRVHDGHAPGVADIVARFLLSVGDRAKNPRYLRGLRCDLAAWQQSLPAGQALSQVEPEHIRIYLRGLQVGPRRRDNVRNELVSLFRFAKANDLLPADRDTAPERVERLGSTHEITFYQPEQLRAFFAHVREEWIPWLALGAFAGIRSTEIVGDPEDPTRPRLKWSDFRWDKAQIIVPGLTARKIKRTRRVPLRPNLLSWLLPWRHAVGPLYPEGADQFQEIERLERRAKLDWQNNALRHSYATHRNAELGNAGQLAEEMGTSVAMIRKHYDAVPADIEPAEYFGIQPAASQDIIIPMPGR